MIGKQLEDAIYFQSVASDTVLNDFDLWNPAYSPPTNSDDSDTDSSDGKISIWGYNPSSILLSALIGITLILFSHKNHQNEIKNLHFS